jgi:hypothetical protein
VPGSEREVKDLKEKFLKGKGSPILSKVSNIGYRLNMEIDLQKVYLGSMRRDAHSCTGTQWLRSRNTPPFPPPLDSYTRALLVSKDRRHLLVTPWLAISLTLSESARNVQDLMDRFLRGRGSSLLPRDISTGRPCRYQVDVAVLGNRNYLLRLPLLFRLLTSYRYGSGSDYGSVSRP